MSRWMALTSTAEAPKAATCYALCCAGEVLYVGQTTNLRARITQHGWSIHNGGIKTPWGSFQNAQIKYRVGLLPGEWLALEYRLIKRLAPRLNKQNRSGSGCLDRPAYREPSAADIPAGVELYRRPIYSLDELSALWSISVAELRVLLGPMVIEAASASAVGHFLETKVGRKLGRRNPWASM